MFLITSNILHFLHYYTHNKFNVKVKIYSRNLNTTLLATAFQLQHKLRRIEEDPRRSEHQNQQQLSLAKEVTRIIRHKITIPVSKSLFYTAHSDRKEVECFLPFWCEVSRVSGPAIGKGV